MPFKRHAAAVLAPLAAGRFVDAESDCFTVNKGPIEMFVSHADGMGQIVPIVKDKVSREIAFSLSHNHGMATNDNEALFNEQLQRRVTELRKGQDWSQTVMAQFVGVPLERYKKYESRAGSTFPAYLLPTIARLTGRSIAYVLTGRDDFGSSKALPQSLNIPSADELARALSDHLPMALSVPEEKRARFLAEVVAESLGLPASLQTSEASGRSRKKAAPGEGAPLPETTT